VERVALRAATVPLRPGAFFPTGDVRRAFRLLRRGGGS